MTEAVTRRVAAVDLGASSGRVMVATVGPDVLRLEEVHRFPNAPVSTTGGLRWDVHGLFDEVRSGLRAAAVDGPVEGIGIDSWAVDYGLLDAAGHLLGDPWCYRDARTDGVAGRVAEVVSVEDQYAVTGVAQLPFNTIYQLVAAREVGELERAAVLLLLPDLLTYWLTGSVGAEQTNASTTGLLEARTGSWAVGPMERLGLPVRLFPALRDAGAVVGALLPEVAADLGLEATVVAVGSHDTASAVVAAPLSQPTAAYLSSGTWSLVGLELREPVLTEAARLAGFTNEGGVDGTIRFLTNVMGLWLLSESLRSWPDARLGDLLTDAAGQPALRTVIDVDDPSLLPPGDMPARLRRLARSAGEPEPTTRAELVRCILDSLALAYRRTVRAAGALAGHEVTVLHVVGGGARNELLCRLTADACGVPVLAGPVEASALGNVLVQARTLGVDLPDLAAMRDLVRRTQEVSRHEPDLGLDWAAAEARLAPRRR